MIDKPHPGHDVRSYFVAFSRWLWLLALCTALAAGGTFIVTRLQQPIYRATTVLVITVPSTVDPSQSNLSATYAKLIMQPVVLLQAASQLGDTSAAQLANSVQAVPDSSTGYLINVSVDDPNPDRAAAIANAVASAFISTVNEQGLGDKYPVQVFQPALPPTTPDHPKPLQNTLIGGVMGFALAVALVHVLIWLGEKDPANQGVSSKPANQDVPEQPRMTVPIDKHVTVPLSRLPEQTYQTQSQEQARETIPADQELAKRTE
jgi:capsular polysaccharide biosynthesis protein